MDKEFARMMTMFDCVEQDIARINASLRRTDATLEEIIKEQEEHEAGIIEENEIHDPDIHAQELEPMGDDYDPDWYADVDR